MNEEAKTRLLLLSISGLLLAVGVGGWLWYNYHPGKPEEKPISLAVTGTLPTANQAPSTTSPIYSASNTVNSHFNAPAASVKLRAPAFGVPIAPQTSLSTSTLTTSSQKIAQSNITYPDKNPVKQSSLPQLFATGKTLLQKLGNMVTTPQSQNIQTTSPNQPNAIEATSNEQHKNSGIYPAIKQTVAMSEAKQSVGRQDPMQSYNYSNALPWPLWHKSSQTNLPSQQGLVPPPPPNESLSDNNTQGLPADALPSPPNKPSVSQYLQLSAIIGERAIFVVPLSVRQENNWPATIALSPGEQFESMSLVSINPDSAVVDENGERKVKALENIK